MLDVMESDVKPAKRGRPRGSRAKGLPGTEELKLILACDIRNPKVKPGDRIKAIDMYLSLDRKVEEGGVVEESESEVLRKAAEVKSVLEG